MAAEPDILAALTPVVEALEALGIPYRIGGSVASSVCGAPRATNDVDLVADIRSEHVEPLWAKELEVDEPLEQALAEAARGA